MNLNSSILDSLISSPIGIKTTKDFAKAIAETKSKAETKSARQKMAADVSASIASAIGYHSEFVNFIHLDRNNKGLKGTGRIFLQEMASAESVIAEMEENPGIYNFIQKKLFLQEQAYLFFSNTSFIFNASQI